ncbi:uncharacterized protein LOC114128992 [Aphis gossypii]|nr:uncharacterized protein LOC114128992 [Aphis gossypii]XP_050063626.1 uncharacterized protein LOC114128992 [Aphis gossypii]
MDTHANFNENEESIECCKSNIKLIVDMITFGKGTLYVTESKLYWKNNANSQVISINYDIMCKYNVSRHPEVRKKKPYLQMIVDFNYIPDEIDQQEDEEDEKFKSIIKLVPDNPECLNEIFEAIASIQPLHFSDNVDDEESESDEHEDSDKNSNTTITSTGAQEDQEAGSTDISNQYHKLDEKSDVKENPVNSIKGLDVPHSPSDSLDDNEYSHDSENDDLELNNSKSSTSCSNVSSRASLHSDMDLASASEDDILLQDEEVLIRSPSSYLEISSRAPLHSEGVLATAFEDDILLQDEEVLINERKRKFEDLPEQEEKPTKIRKLWNFMKYPFQKITSFSTSISENEPNTSITEAIAGKKNSLEPETAVCENNSDIVKPVEETSQNNSETDGENEDTSQKFCKIM